MPPLSQQDLVLLALVAGGAAFMLWKRFGGNSQALPPEQLLELKRQGALVLDVRSAAEFAGGHVKGSRNIPLGSLAGKLGELKKDQVILTVCASGMRSGSARRTLLKAGFTQVHNAGPWQTLKD
jgi:rhodanese-related sulfurtransferase